MGVPQVKRLLALEEKRKKLQRQIDAIKSEERVLKTDLISFIKKKVGRKKRVITIGKFVLSVVKVKKRVQWKSEFVRLAGAEAAQKIAEATPSVEALKVSQK